MAEKDDKTLELLAALENAASSARKLKEELQAVSSNALKAAREAAENNAQIVAALDKELEKRDYILKNLERENKLAKDKFKREKDALKQYELALDLNKTKIKQLEQELAYLDRNDEKYQSIKQSIDKIRDDNGAIVASQKEFTEQLEKTKKVTDDIEGTIKGIASSLSTIAKGDFASGFKQLGNSLAEPLKKIAGKGFQKAKDDLITSFSKMGQKLPELAAGAEAGAAGLGAMGPAAISTGAALGTLGAALFVVLPLLIAFAAAIGIAVKIAQFALELENSARQMTKVTGLSKDFSSAMLENADSLREFGATTEDINNATIALNATFTDFSSLNKSTANEVKNATVVLGKLGMSADDVAMGMQNLTKGFGQMPQEAANTMLELDAVARDLNISTTKMGADFNAAAGSLKKLSGPEAIGAFKQLAIVSKATGIEVSRLLAITDQFDTFEGAATQAGKLNAALGGNFVNAMELMTATNPVERFEMIRDSILDSGLAFDEMSYYQKKFFADAAGMQDVGELALAMSGDFGAVGAEIGKTQSDYEAAAERAKEFQSVQEQLASTMQSLIPVVKPLIKFIGETTLAFSEFVLEYKDGIQATFKGLLFFTAALAVNMVLLSLPLLIITGIIGGMAIGFIKLISLFGDLVGWTGLFRKAITTDADSPTLLGGLEIMASTLERIANAINDVSNPIDKMKGKLRGFRKEMFSGDNNLIAGVEMTAAGMEGIGDASAKTAATMRATAPTIANNTAIRNATNNTTINNNGQGGSDTGISIKFDNKKFADLFDVQVEKSIGRAARKAVI